MPSRAAARAASRVPRAGGRKPPSRSSSARNRRSSPPRGNAPEAWSSDTARARSRGSPRLGISAGTRLNSTLPLGKDRPCRAKAAGSRSRASRATASGMPTRSTRDRPRPRQVSTCTRWPPPCESVAPSTRVASGGGGVGLIFWKTEGIPVGHGTSWRGNQVNGPARVVCIGMRSCSIKAPTGRGRSSAPQLTQVSRGCRCSRSSARPAVLKP